MRIKNTSFSKERVLKIYRDYVSKATSYYKQAKYNKSIKYIALAANWMYYFNVIYFDEIVEKLIHSISSSIFKNTEEYKPDDDCVVFLDSICTTKCLGIQYLKALMALNKKIVYIQHRNLADAKKISAILDNYENTKIYTVESTYSYVERAEIINKIIVDNRPSSILLHMPAYDVVSLLSIANIRSAVKFNIDLQDHSFWLGRSFVEYDVVFRDYGEKIAKEKRQLQQDQIIRLPYYPLIKYNSNFAGFPEELPSDAITIFTGGAPYKMLGKKDIFFKLIDILLNISPKVHILIATDNSDAIKQKVNQVQDTNRVHLIGYRKDIDQVFKHSDIYLSTYPFIGGLMSQYAAASGLPILAYAEPAEPNVVEGLVNHKNKAVQSQRSIQDFTKYAKRLINESSFRCSEGKLNKEALFSANDFTLGLEEVLTKKQTIIQWYHKENPDYDGMINFYLENENNDCHSGLITSIMYLNLGAFKYFFKESLTIIQLICRGTYKRILQRIK